MKAKCSVNNPSMCGHNSHGVSRVVAFWAWCSIGIIWLAIEGLLAFLSMAFVGIIAVAFVFLRFTHFRRFCRRGL